MALPPNRLAASSSSSSSSLTVTRQTYTVNRGIVIRCCSSVARPKDDRYENIYISRTESEACSQRDGPRLRGGLCGGFLFGYPVHKMYTIPEEDVNATVGNILYMHAGKGRKGGIKRSNDVHTA